MKNKYSKVEFKNEGTFILGAPDFLTKDKNVLELINKYQDYRCILLMHEGKFRENVALILIKDKIRKNASNTLNYFKMQGVDIKIISGDSINTVSSVAKRVGLDNIKCIDMSNNKIDNLKQIVEEYNIFCRVSPQDKKELIKALKSNNHTVAMTGDGVNDCLALKEADSSIAMASGSDAARNVSQIVLLDSNFDAVTDILLEGRRTINNIERSATLFLTKTLYATMLATLFLFISMDYPFQPIQLGLVNLLNVGIPGFILALEPNKERIQGNFLSLVVQRAFPISLTIYSVIIITPQKNHNRFHAYRLESVGIHANVIPPKSCFRLLPVICRHIMLMTVQMDGAFIII